jgi:vacuolar-type H+-ATPase subunit I/STV1
MILATVPLRQWNSFELPVSSIPAVYIAARKPDNEEILVVAATTPENTPYARQTLTLLEGEVVDLPSGFGGSPAEMQSALEKELDKLGEMQRTVEKDAAEAASQWRSRVNQAWLELSAALASEEALSAFEAVGDYFAASFEVPEEEFSALRRQFSEETTEAYTIWSLPARQEVGGRA